MTLLIMAAGSSPDFGDCKPLVPITEGGPCMIDFAIHDALCAGFNKIVLVIEEKKLPLFQERIDAKYAHRVPISYVFQNIDDIPEWTHVPRGREKPWGTAHAILAARDEIREPFGVVNGDDFYGAEAYRLLAQHLATADPYGSPAPFCMVGYTLCKTITPYGSFSRAICDVAEDGFLRTISERGRISDVGRATVSAESGRYQIIPNETVVSMNCWGFTPEIFDHLLRGFSIFAKRNASDRVAEYHLPVAVRELMDRRACTVRVYHSNSHWCGLTYREDLAHVQKKLAELVQQGHYTHLFPRDFKF